VAAVLISITLYTLVFEIVGFAVATFLLFLFLLKTIDHAAWKSAFLISLAATVAGFFLFQVWLQVQLPEGWIGWWRISKWIF
jgi:DsbC/DsbD-like thiol-disulfide interchange protein